MKILVVGNILKDVYLNLDNRTEHFESDKNNVKWLNLSFDASEHHFFSRESSLGGAAISLEVLQKLGVEAAIAGSDLSFKNEDPIKNITSIYRYILVVNGQTAYFAPSKFTETNFIPPEQPFDYLYLDRSAEITSKTSQKISDYLEQNPQTKLIVYFRDFNNHHLNNLSKQASLIFSEVSDAPELANFDPTKIIKISEERLSYLDIIENISAKRINITTHLSLYSIASATILGSFVLGKSVEESLKLARINIENSKLNISLSLSELQELSTIPSYKDNLELIAKNLVLPPKGILAADESEKSIHKRFESLNIEDTYDNRRDYRNLLFTTPNLEKYLNGIILFDETTRQTADNGQNFVDYLISRRIIPGIKVDQGLEKFENSEETYTKGLESLSNRLQAYYQMGLRFAKWRAAFTVSPSKEAVDKNCEILAEYAKTCQNSGFVPIVEPELLYDGNYDIKASASCTAQILDSLFDELAKKEVNLNACILKVNMVLAGKDFETQSTPEEVGINTAEILKNHVPPELAGVAFLSGGQTPEQATENLSAIMKQGPFPWPITFSFARALQAPALETWQGNNDNKKPAQEIFLGRLEKNQIALKG